ncbi:heme-binding protein [Gallaecimonas kandeliae]|uniref:GlcG/HbpS family heme-binding protein n=1 Tax=Gallaecimonas kandeliae TaxID=3029055 RepID=UPI0026478042|nr:heme-binding protein [Gallaecimonas kandeliae]WKE67111.1 heme-binding protein [Gallaecimonas kandeliae]
MTSAKVIEYGNPILLNEAKRVLAAAEEEAVANGLAVIIAIVDSAAQLVALHRLDHAQFGSIAVATAKAEAAVKFKRPTQVFEGALSQGGVHLRLLAIGDATPIAGGIPLVRDGKIIGAIGVAGMLPEQDLQVAAAGAAAL